MSSTHGIIRGSTRIGRAEIMHETLGTGRSYSTVKRSSITNSIVFGEGQVSDSTLDDSVVGHHAEDRGFTGTPGQDWA